MRPSPLCFDFVRSREGLSLRIYPDAGGRPTVGFGHLCSQSDILRYSSGISTSEALALLELDLERVGLRVDELTAGLGLAQHEYDALSSFAFNVGPEELANSTLLRLLKAGDKAGAADQFTLWDHAGGRVIPGLYERRVAEREMFLGLPWSNGEVA